jgi:hypothetical protein
MYDRYKKRGYTDDQICILEDISRNDLAKFKDKHRILTARMIPDHLLKKAESLGIHPDTVIWRMKHKKMDMWEACTTPKEEKTVTQTQLDEAKEKYGLAASTIYRRIKKGMSVEDALNTPNNYHTTKSLPKFLQDIKMSDLVKLYRQNKKDVSVFEFVEELRRN